MLKKLPVLVILGQPPDAGQIEKYFLDDRKISPKDILPFGLWLSKGIFLFLDNRICSIFRYMINSKSSLIRILFFS